MKRAGYVCRPCLAAIRLRETAIRLPTQPSQLFATRHESGHGDGNYKLDDIFEQLLVPTRTTPEGQSGQRKTGSRSTVDHPDHPKNKETTPTFRTRNLRVDRGVDKKNWNLPLSPSERARKATYQSAIRNPEPESEGAEDARLKGNPEDAQLKRDQPDAAPILATLGKGARREPVGNQLSMGKDRILQFSRLQKETPPEDYDRAARQFRIWKSDFAQAWTQQLRSLAPGVKRVKPVFTSRDSSQDTLRALLRADGELEHGVSDGVDAPLQDESVENMRARWLNKSSKGGKAAWPYVMAAALKLTPERAHRVFQATFEDNIAPFYAVRDTVAFFAKRYHLLVKARKPYAASYGKLLAPIVLRILRETSHQYVEFTQHTLWTICTVTDPETLLDLYSELIIYRHPIDPHTKLHFIAAIAKIADYKKYALDMFRDLVQEDLPKEKDLELDSPPVMAACTSLLAFSEEDAVDTALSELRAYLLEQLISLGIQPNLITFTTLIRNLCLAQDLENAFQIFDMVRQQGLAPDMHLYSVLLNGCKQAENFRMMGKLIRLIAEDGNREDPVVWNDVIHAIHYVYSRNAEHGPPVGPYGHRALPVFQPMLLAYSKLFNLEPLQRLLPMHDLQKILNEAKDPGMVSFTQGPWMPKVEELLQVLNEIEGGSAPVPRSQPSADTLVIMLIGYLRSHSSIYPVFSFYATFRRMIRDSVDEAVQIAQHTTAVHDNVIRFLGRWPGMLRVSLDVINDMLEDAAYAASMENLSAGITAMKAHRHTLPPSVDPQESLPLSSPIPSEALPTNRHPAPSVYTWSVLLTVLLNNKQFEQAERLLDAMRQHGIQPNRVTWNTLIAGYARNQSVQGTVSALRRAEQSGDFKPDDFTIKAFQYLTHQEEALAMMEGMVKRRADLGPADAAAEFRHLQTTVEELSQGMDPNPSGEKAFAVRAARVPTLDQVVMHKWLPYNPKVGNVHVGIGGVGRGEKVVGGKEGEVVDGTGVEEGSGADETRGEKE